MNVFAANLLKQVDRKMVGKDVTCLNQVDDESSTSLSARHLQCTKTEHHQVGSFTVLNASLAHAI